MRRRRPDHTVGRMSVTSPALFKDRRAAGRRLAERLERLRGEAPVVLALERGGVPVAAEVAAALAAPLDLLVVHKAGEPGSHVGAVTEDGLAVVDHERARVLGISSERLAALREHAGVTAAIAARRLRGGRPLRDIVGRTVVLVDDAAGTGATAIAAARAARRRGAARVVLALPVAHAAVLARLGEELDEIVCVAVGPLERWYEHAPAVSDAEIEAALTAPARLPEDWLHVPEAARGAVVLATPSEAIRRVLTSMGFATLVLPAGHAVATAALRLRAEPATERLATGCFGLGGDAEAVLVAAAGADFRAVVAAGGRPDRAGPRLAQVTAATLLVVGGEDRHVLRLAREACRQLAGEHELAVVPGATHDFPERGACEQVAHLAGIWFARHL
jgi:putative phosphoribosyl transferase